MKLNECQIKIIDDIKQSLLTDQQQLFLIKGDFQTGKTKIISSLPEDMNMIVLNSDDFHSQDPDLKNSNLYNFFGLSLIYPFSIFKTKINNKLLTVSHENYEERFFIKKNKKVYFSLSPHEKSTEYKIIFMPSKNSERFKSFLTYPNISNNILIIDDIDKIDRKILLFIDFNLKIIFKNENPFGGLNVLLLGNPFHQILNKNSSFSLENFSDEINILSSFKQYELKECVVSLKKRAKELFFHESIAINYDIDFSKDVYKNFTDAIYLSHEKEFIKSFLKYYINNKNKKIFTIQSKLNTEDPLFKSLKPENSYYYINFYNDTLYFMEDEKVFFIQNVEEYEIKKGQFGILKKINWKINNKDNSFICDEIIAIVEVNGKSFEITDLPFKCIHKKKEIYSKSQLPFVLAKCLEFKYMKFVPKTEKIIYVIDSKNTFHFIKKVICNRKKIDLLAFQNTVFLAKENEISFPLLFL